MSIYIFSFVRKHIMIHFWDIMPNNRILQSIWTVELLLQEIFLKSSTKIPFYFSSIIILFLFGSFVRELTFSVVTNHTQLQQTLSKNKQIKLKTWTSTPSNIIIEICNEVEKMSSIILKSTWKKKDNHNNNVIYEESINVFQSFRA